MCYCVLGAVRARKSKVRYFNGYRIVASAVIPPVSDSAEVSVSAITPN